MGPRSAMSSTRLGTYACAVWLFVSLMVSSVPGQQAEDYFESKVRPLLHERCLRCHGLGEASKSGLQLNSRDSVLKGGDRGPALVPGKPSESLIIEAVKRTGELAMPPDVPLDPDEVSILEQWIRDGAAWPASKPASTTETELWSLRPVQAHIPPEVEHAELLQTPIDAFVESGLENSGLRLSLPVDRLTWLRRVSFDLIGLPPTRSECESFLDAPTPDAEHRVVDRLLASHHYAERWARHWLDVVRYSETNGFEDDFEKPNIHRFRDYVIDAYNLDLPYDRFVLEQIAGDQLPSPRVSPDGRTQASSIASGFWWLGEIMPLPFCEEDAQRIADNETETQVDAYGRAFLGLTLACARCHDHKFDPLVQADYEAVAGSVRRTTNIQECIETQLFQKRMEDVRREIESIDRQLSQYRHDDDFQKAATQARLQRAQSISEHLLASFEFSRGMKPTESNITRMSYWGPLLARAFETTDPVLYPWQRLATATDDAFTRRADALSLRLREMNQSLPRADRAWADFENGFGDWLPTGEAFGARPTPRSQARVAGVGGQALATTDHGIDALTGRLVSPKFTVTEDKRFLFFRVCGGDVPSKTCVNLVLHSQAMPQRPPFWTVTGQRTRVLKPHWFDLKYYMNMEVFIEVVDDYQGDWGHISVDDFYFSSKAPHDENVFVNPLIIDAMAGAKDRRDLAQRIEDLCIAALQRDSSNPDDNEKPWSDLKAWLTIPGSPVGGDEEIEPELPSPWKEELASLKARRASLVAKCRPSSLALTSRDRPTNSHKSKGNKSEDSSVRRGVPVSFASAIEATPTGSGRWELARWTASADNPLTARVYANRVWKHHFDRGLVATPDNFGMLGDRPSHPELLDYLSTSFIEAGWSTKYLHRLICVSSAYRQPSRSEEPARTVDPLNQLVHRYPVRRLEAECIRDAVLRIAGVLDDRYQGPSTPLTVEENVMLEQVPTPGAKPGERCRSIYLQVRRNHLPTLFDAFDFPRLPSPTGDRGKSALPVQALEMLNSEFAREMSRIWAERSLREGQVSEESVIESIYWDALGRPPTPTETALANEFRSEQARLHETTGMPSDEARRQSWTDLCHVMLNLGEFIYLE